MFSRLRLLAATASLATFASLAPAQEIPNEGPIPTTAIISVQSKQGAAVQPGDLRLEVNGHDAQISSLVPVSREGAQVAILIDDGLRGSFGVQAQDIKKFVAALPPNIQVLVGYMQNGIVRQSGGFSTDHAAVAQQVRIPMSTPGISGSPYFCLQDFVKHWPGRGNAARIALMITNGVDLYNGSVSPLNQDSPYVQHAQNEAQRAGVAVYAIYWNDAGIRGGLANFSGQSYLNQVADATGGQSFYQGQITPPSLKPYLDDFRRSISESYLLNFNAPAHDRRNDLTPIKVKSDQPGVKVRAPHGVHPGMVEQAQEQEPR